MILSLLAGNDMSYSAGIDTASALVSNVILNVGSNETQRNITWYSNIFTEGEVRYAKVSDMSGGEFPSVYKTAKAVAVRTVGGEYSYKATLMSLEENTDYVYCIVTGDTVSDYYKFSVNNFDSDFSFGFFADAQLEDDEKEGSGWKTRLSRIISNFNDMSFMVSAGDQVNNPVSETQYDYFITDEFASIPVSTTVGPGHDDAVLFNEHYNLPNLSSKYGVTTTSSDYFYKYNNVLVMHINCDNGVYDNHVNFIKNAISANPDCVWRVVVIHYSFFSGGNHSNDDGVKGFREALAGKFNELEIDLVLSGHDHNYARSHMMLDDKTISSDIVTDNSVTNPEGTLYLCGATASGTKYYSEVETEYDKFISCKRDGTRSTFTVFDVTDTSLTMNSYFTNNTELEKFDTFTINKSPEPFKLNSKSNMIEFASTVNGDYIPLVNAHAYSSAILRVENSEWKISTDNGESYQNLGVLAKSADYILRINPETKVWEYSSDDGESYISTFISSSSFSVKYINIPGSSFGDNTDLSAFAARAYTTSSPDAPVIYMHKGSVEEGQINNWKWEYYLASGDGNPVTDFSAGNEYLAYLVNNPTPVASIIYVSKTEDPENYTYTWKNAWDIAEKCYADNLTVKLAENITLESSDDIAKFELPVKATFDLNGYTLNSSDVDRVFRFSTGSNEAVFNIISSRENGTFNCDSKDFMYLDSSSGSTLTVNVGSDDSYPITVKKCAYFVNSGSNFRNASTINLNITKTDVTFTNTFLRITNVKTTAGKNIYTVKSKYSNFNFKGSSAYFIKNNDGMLARNSSSFVAENCTFKNTFDNNSKAFINADLWLGSMNFTNCAFDGIALDANKIPSMATMIIGDGCSFKNSAKTFDENSLAFSGNNMMLDAGCELVNDAAAGVINVVKNSQDEEIFFIRTIVDGVKKYYPEGTNLQDVLDACDTTSAKNIEITLGADVALSEETKLENATNYNMTIDLAGNSLTVSNKLNLSGSGYNISIFSSKPGGKYIVSDDSYIQPKVEGTLTFGSQLYKKYLKIESSKFIVSMGMIPSGTFNANYLYSDISVSGGNEGILTLNALGKSAITLGVNITGCNVSVAKGVFSYSPSSTLSANTNGGVFDADSVINISDSTFTCGDGATTSTGFFVRTSKLKDRFYGKMYVEGSTFTNFYFNGDGIYSDKLDLSYTFNTYYETLSADYDATKCITIGEGCSFSNYYATFNDANSKFSASNTSLVAGYKLYYDEVKDEVSVVVKDETDEPETPQEPEDKQFYIRTEIDGTVKDDYEEGTSLSTVLTACDKAGNKNIKITFGADFSLSSNNSLDTATNYNLEIDLAGHTLTISKKFGLEGAGFNLSIYSSVEGGKIYLKGSDGCIKPKVAGTITLGSEEYKNNMSVESEAYIVDFDWVSSGTVGVNYLYTDIIISANNNGIIRLNALGSAAITLNSNIKGCDVTVVNSVICYNASSTLSATKNGGIFNADSQINVKDCTFTSTAGTAESPKGFFGQTTNFKDRYYGTVNFENCVFDKVRINGGGIYSDNSVTYTYNEYYKNLPTDHVYSKRIIVGKDCRFYNTNTTFNDDFTDFYTNNYNMTLADKCLIEKTKDSAGKECVVITHIPEFLISSYKNESGKPTVTIEIPLDGTYTVVFADYEETELIDFDIVTQEFKFGKTDVTGTKNIILGAGDKVMIWDGTSLMTPLCKPFEINKQ